LDEWDDSRVEEKIENLRGDVALAKEEIKGLDTALIEGDNLSTSLANT